MRLILAFACVLFLGGIALAQTPSPNGVNGPARIKGTITATHCVSGAGGNYLQDSGGTCGGGGSSISLSNTTSSVDYFLGMTTSTSGTLSTLYGDSTHGLKYHASTGVLSVPSVSLTSPLTIANGGTGQAAAWSPSGGGNIVVFGDSLTAGDIGVTSCASHANYGLPTAVGSLTGTCWSDLVGVHFNMPVINFGNDGAPLEHCVNHSGGGCAFSGIDYYPTVLASTTSSDYLLMMFGVNDGNYLRNTTSSNGEPSYTFSNFRNNYDTIIAAAIAQGVPKSHIGIAIPPWRPGPYSIAGQPNAWLYNFYSAAALSALDEGVPVVDVFPSTALSGYLSSTVTSWEDNWQIYQGNNGHPDDNGNKYEAAAIENPVVLTPLQAWAKYSSLSSVVGGQLFTTGVEIPSVDSNGGSLGIGSFGASSLNPPLSSLTTCLNQFAGYNAIAIGQRAMGSGSCTMTTASLNDIAIGASAMQGLTSGAHNTAVGSLAGRFSITTSGNNTAIGDSAMAGSFGLGGASDNTAIGTNALLVIQRGSLQNSAVGSGALKAMTSTNDNTALGYQAGDKITTGGSNVVIGPNVASTTLTIGSNNILIGTTSALDTSTSSTSNAVDIGNIYQGDSSLGSVWLGTSSLTTTATDGFVYIPITAGAPTGTPTTHTGFAPMQYDTANHKLWVYDGGWKGVVLN